jgi:hypothetical protein
MIDTKRLIDFGFLFDIDKCFFFLIFSTCTNLEAISTSWSTLSLKSAASHR